MVAIFPKDNASRSTLFPCLKPCSPAPGIAPASAAATDLFSRPVRLRKSRRRWLSLIFGSVQAAALSFGLWTSALPQTAAVESSLLSQTTEQQPQNELWNTLGSDALAQTMLAVTKEQTEAALTAAEQERLQAQQLRLDAEAKAQTLTTQAAEQARQKTVEAIRRADLINLDATYIGAEQVLYPQAGSDITLKFAARIQCKDGSFGETAVASPVDSRITPREVRNLAVCYPNPQADAGKPIGQAGEWGVAFFKLD